MKSSRSFSQRARASAPLRARQGGTILIIALIVLVAMTLAGIATMRSVDTATTLQTAHTGAMNYSADAPKIPAAAVSVEDALLMQRL